MDRTPAVEVEIGGERRRLDLDEALPDWAEGDDLSRGAYPYAERMKRKAYERTLHALQVELVKLQAWQQESGTRIVCVFEGRDAAGKGGAIKRVREHLNPRQVRIVALPKPTERERTEWYFQRYVAHLPAAGEAVLFDRSWYNRAGVERVMGFAEEAQVRRFLHEAPRFEDMLTDDGIVLVKFWLGVDRVTQIRRFHARRHDPLKTWKLSPMDIEALTRWDAYTEARDAMFAATHTEHAPWTVIRANDKRRARIEAIRAILLSCRYEGRDENAIGEPDGRIVGGPEMATGE
jgi:polyphosphate kinase 2